MNISNKTVLITGGGSGIGRALALRMAAKGAIVYIVGRNSVNLSRVVSEGKGSIRAITADVTSTASLNVIRTSLRAHGAPLDILVNNAGVQYAHDLSDTQAHQSRGNLFDVELATNLIAPMNLTLALLDTMRAPGGVIVNLTSVLAIHPKSSAPVYCASKAALRSWTKSLRHQLSPRGIKVEEAIPPLVETAMTKGRGHGKITTEQAAAEIVDGIESGRHEILVGKARLFMTLNRFIPGLLARKMIGE